MSKSQISISGVISPKIPKLPLSTDYPSTPNKLAPSHSIAIGKDDKI